MGAAFDGGNFKMRVRVLALTASLLALAMTGSAQAAGGPAALWHFDEGQGTAVGDDSGNGHNGTLSGSLTWVPSMSGFGYALNYSGGGMVTVPAANGRSSLEPARAVSVSAWVMQDGTPGHWKYILAKGATTGAASYGLDTGSEGGLEFYVASDANAGDAVYSTDGDQSLWDGNWHLIVGTWDGSTVRLYVDGNEVGTEPAYSGTISYPGGSYNSLYIGSYPLCDSPQFPGNIDEVGIWDRALSQADIFNLLMGPYNPSTGTGEPGPTVGSTGDGGASGVTPPILSQLRVSPSRFATTWKVSHRGKRTIVHKRKTGTAIGYTDTQQALTLFTVMARESGVRRGKRCVKPSKGGTKHARRCTFYAAVDRFTHSDSAGANSFHFSGSVSGHALGPGSYVLDATPVMVGAVRGATMSVSFAVIR
jgi:Concanavalin A-like lectin/glucanases superfamily